MISESFPKIRNRNGLSPLLREEEKVEISESGARVWSCHVRERSQNYEDFELSTLQYISSTKIVCFCHCIVHSLIKST